MSIAPKLQFQSLPQSVLSAFLLQYFSSSGVPISSPRAMSIQIVTIIYLYRPNIEVSVSHSLKHSLAVKQGQKEFVAGIGARPIAPGAIPL